MGPDGDGEGLITIYKVVPQFVNAFSWFISTMSLGLMNGGYIYNWWFGGFYQWVSKKIFYNHLYEGWFWVGLIFYNHRYGGFYGYPKIYSITIFMRVGFGLV